MTDETPKRSIWVGFDLGGTKMLAVVFDDKLKVLAKLAIDLLVIREPKRGSFNFI